MPQLVQILLPLYDADGSRFPTSDFAFVRDELVHRFGGATAFTRAPAEGVWKDGEKTVEDDIIVVEVMADIVDVHWWTTFRAVLERRFRQDTIVVRHHRVDLI